DASVRARHRDEWDDTGAAGDQLHGLGLSRPPNKPTAERASELDIVSEFELVDEKGGDFTVWQAVDGQFDLLARSGTGDGVGAHGLIPVRCGEPHIDVLSGIAAWPVGHSERDA